MTKNGGKDTAPTRAPTIESLWITYEQNVMPKDAGDVQRAETKRAFFAGCAVILGTIAELPDNLSDDEGSRILGGWRAECVAFTRQQMAW